jgi:CBS domain-containing protein
MPTVQDILGMKGSKIHFIHPQTNVLEATQTMNEHKIGALVVMQDDHVAGMFTERDVLRRVVAAQKDPATLKVEDVMTRDVICCSPETDLDEAGAIFKHRRIRHLPICDPDGQLLGMISIGDLNAWYASNQEQTIHYLSEYIYGRV